MLYLSTLPLYSLSTHSQSHARHSDSLLTIINNHTRTHVHDPFSALSFSIKLFYILSVPGSSASSLTHYRQQLHPPTVLLVCFALPSRLFLSLPTLLSFQVLPLSSQQYRVHFQKVHIPIRTPCAAMDHAIGFPANGSAVYSQTAPMLASKFDHHDPQLVENPGTAEQNANVRKMLLVKTSRADICSIVQIYKDLKKASIDQMQDNLSGLKRDELDQVICANTPKRKMSEDPDEAPASSPQHVKRSRKALEGKGPIHEKPAKVMLRVKAYGCPGDKNMCQGHKNRQ